MTMKLMGANRLLLNTLLEQDLLQEAEVPELLEQFSRAGGRLADFVLDSAILSEFELLQFYEQKYGYKIANFSMLERIDPETIRVIPANLAQLQMVIPFKEIGSELHLAFLEPPDLAGIQSMKGLAGREVVVYLAPREVLRWAIAKHYPELYLTPADPSSLSDPFENRIGYRLIAEGLLTRQQLEEALLERTPGKAGRTGELLLRMGYIAEDDLYRSLAAQLKIPFVKIPPEYQIPPEVARLLTQAEVQRYQCVPVFADEQSITMLSSEPSVLPELEVLFKRNLSLMLSTPTQIKFLSRQLEPDVPPLLRVLGQQGKLGFEDRAKVLEAAQASNLEQVLEQRLDSATLEFARQSLPSDQVIPISEPWELSFSGRLAHTLAEQLGATYVDPNEDPPDASLQHLIPEKTMRQYLLFPYRQTDQGLQVLMTDPRNIFALNELEALLEQPIEAVMADRLEIERFIEAASQLEPIELEEIVPVSESLEQMLRRLIRDELKDFRIKLLEDLRS